MSLLVSVVIPTFNRARLLGETLDRIAAHRVRLAPASWEVVVVDNNSTDETDRIVGARQARYPVALRYVFERTQGRSAALNAGIAAARAPIIVMTDDDVLVADGWLDAASAPLLDPASEADYTGGPVIPIWETPRPRWLSGTKGDLWGTIAILNYGSEPFVFERRRRVPLGANMAVRRTLVDLVGGFNTTLGRTGSKGHVLGQEVPEFLVRTRNAGRHGLYVPEMIVNHHVPAKRLTKQYFRRWWFGKGMSRAQLDRLRTVDELGVDLSRARKFRDVPLFMFRQAALDFLMLIVRPFDIEERFRREMMLAYFVGYIAGCRRVRQSMRPAMAS
jgi:glycosyltransferase involved in cell wall biosynthesis